MSHRDSHHGFSTCNNSTRNNSTFKKRARGYDCNLYRDPARGWIFGVCAGIARAYQKPVWLVRIAALTLFLFSGSLAVFLYIVGYFLLGKRSVRVQSSHVSPPRFDYSESNSVRARRVAQNMEDIDLRLQAIERYVTSNRYRVNEELRGL